MSNVSQFPTKKCCECGARATKTLELCDLDTGAKVDPKLYCDAHFPTPLDEDGLRLLLDARDAEIGKLRTALRKLAEQDYDAGYSAETFAEAVLSNWPGVLE